MPSNVFEMLASLVVANFAGVEFFVVFDSIMNKLYAISAIDVIKKQFESLTPINKASEIKALGRVKFIGLKDFLVKYPESNIDAYLQANHMSKRDIYEALELSDLPELRGPEALGEDLELPPIAAGDRSAA